MMIQILYQLASSSSDDSVNLLDSLGIDVSTLVFQLIAFFLLVFILSKWVYPIFVNIIEKREAAIEQSTKDADRLRAEAAESETKTATILSRARKQATEIVAHAKDEAEVVAANTEQKAVTKSEALMAQAEAHIEQDKNRAREELLKEVSSLVSSATEKIIGDISNQEIDDALIEEALKEAN